VALPHSNYFYHRARQEVADKYAEIRQTMAGIFDNNHRCYGYRRIHACLSDQSVNISEKVVRRLMKQERLVAATSKRCRYGAYMGEISLAPDNLLYRDFNAFAPNEKWLTDITEFQIPAGEVYLSPMIDCFDGLVFSWSSAGRWASGRTPNWSTRCWMPPLTRSLSAASDLWCIRIVAATIDGRAGWPASLMRSWFVRCRARGSRWTTLPARASSTV
jgi:hypothetical protein